MRALRSRRYRRQAATRLDAWDAERREQIAELRTTSAAVVVATHDRQLLRDPADRPRPEVGTPPTPGG
ncbi:hypothetical protein FNQ90_20675 [Streptomyces alkaliphilus]|uniref:ABC transporter ATP-binding protein n=1 Tax=Streptomyces alkaliphilus TaxID=1472722 RepID=A0A7W3Y3J4_9ACTN|nr:hypothetical protein [Streptomyces alkaliphilus]MBB0246460.1 hypothetical protein [Streptomyces alkaliphilus]